MSSCSVEDVEDEHRNAVRYLLSLLDDPERRDHILPRFHGSVIHLVATIRETTLRMGCGDPGDYVYVIAASILHESNVVGNSG